MPSGAFIGYDLYRSTAKEANIVFQELPGNFFFPLASPHRNHYAELLLVYYNLFMEYHTGIEREQVVSAFENYFEKLPDLVVFQEDQDLENSLPEEKPEVREEREEITAPRALASRFLGGFSPTAG